MWYLGMETQFGSKFPAEKINGIGNYSLLLHVNVKYKVNIECENNSNKLN